MRRILTLASLPLLLLALWVASGSGSSSNAEATIVTSDVEGLRSNVIAQLGQLGAVRVKEETDFGDATTSVIEFRLPASKIEQALDRLDEVGGTLTDQQVDLDLNESGDLGNDLDNLGDCLGKLDPTSVAPEQLTNMIELCRAGLREAEATVAATEIGGNDATLLVHLDEGGSRSWLLTIGALVGLAGIAALAIWRTRGLDHDGFGPSPELEEEIRLPNSDTREIYLRRN